MWPWYQAGRRLLMLKFLREKTLAERQHNNWFQKLIFYPYSNYMNHLTQKLTQASAGAIPAPFSVSVLVCEHKWEKVKFNGVGVWLEVKCLARLKGEDLRVSLPFLWSFRNTSQVTMETWLILACNTRKIKTKTYSQFNGNLWKIILNWVAATLPQCLGNSEKQEKSEAQS